jgi:hypothetical protein
MTNMNKNNNLYTFFVHFVDHDFVEEIDVNASSEAEAWGLAEAEARDLYGSDVSLEMTAAGGSGGLIFWATA